jgi:ferredoxin
MLLKDLVKTVLKKEPNKPVYENRTGEKRFKKLEKSISYENNNILALKIDEIKSPLETLENTSYKLVLEKQDVTIVAKSNKSILENILDANIKVKYSCGSGGCGACKVKAKGSNISIKEPNCLTLNEKKAGFILSCISYSNGEIILDI